MKPKISKGRMYWFVHYQSSLGKFESSRGNFVAWFDTWKEAVAFALKESR